MLEANSDCNPPSTFTEIPDTIGHVDETNNLNKKDLPADYWFHIVVPKPFKVTKKGKQNKDAEDGDLVNKSEELCVTKGGD